MWDETIKDISFGSSYSFVRTMFVDNVSVMLTFSYFRYSEKSIENRLWITIFHKRKSNIRGKEFRYNLCRARINFVVIGKNIIKAREDWHDVL